MKWDTFHLIQLSANLLFQIISRRYGHGSIIITSNISYFESVLATAVRPFIASLYNV
ncbi:ATP-binding protein [Neobacillus cucumis]|uniref:ATP-binding protein n=1 Tax=Neobacillus cucumis TaxID=1740721 RepID=UPI0023BAE27B|nr:ATP-binding protein [Neobacillus cucumis]